MLKIVYDVLSIINNLTLGGKMKKQVIAEIEVEGKIYEIIPFVEEAEDPITFEVMIQRAKELGVEWNDKEEIFQLGWWRNDLPIILKDLQGKMLYFPGWHPNYLNGAFYLKDFIGDYGFTYWSLLFNDGTYSFSSCFIKPKTVE